MFVWLTPLILTLQLMVVAVLIAAVLGIVGGWSASALHSGSRYERLTAWGLLAAMVLTVSIPMILHAAAWEATAGKFGWMMMTQTGTRADSGSPYGFFGGLLACGWIHGLIGAALVTIACWLGTMRVPGELLEQSRLELSPLRQWWQIRLPLAAPWWVTALVATAMLAATEMTVVDLYGYRTLADEFYLLYAADPSIASVLRTCVVPLAVFAGGIVWWAVSLRRPFASGFARNGLTAPNDPCPLPWRMVAMMIAIVLILLAVATPLTGLLIKLGHQVTVEQDQVIAGWSASAAFSRLLEAPRVFAEEYLWTITLSAATACVAVAIAWPLASLSRTDRNRQRWLDLVTVAVAILPGPIVAMTVVQLFQWNLPGFRMLYQQTIVPTVVALLARGIPVSYWVLRAAYRSIDDAVLDAASLELNWARRMRSIDFPILRGALLTAWLCSAVVASGDVPATLPVIPPGMTTVGTRLFGLLHSGARYQEAALALWYVAAITVISVFLFRQQVAGRVRLK